MNRKALSFTPRVGGGFFLRYVGQRKIRGEAGVRLHWRLWTILAGIALLSSVKIVKAAPLLAPPADAEVVGQAELIAVGHLKENSIQYIPHPLRPWEDKEERDSNPNKTNFVPHPLSWEHHATLLVSEVIKGQCSSNSIPIILHYGLEPIVGGYANHDGFMMDIRQGNTNYPTNVVQIVCLPGSQMIFPIKPLVEDVSKDKIWFLIRGSGINGEKPDTTNDFSVMGCQIQPLNLEEYFKLYLGPDPETALKSYAVGHPELADRIQRWLDGLAFKAKWEAVLKIQDPAVKAAKLAVYLKSEPSLMGLRDEMAKLGAAAVPELIKAIRAGMTNGEDLNYPVLILYDIGKPAQPAVPVLLELLEKPGKTSRYYICGALKTAADKSAIPYLRPMLKVDDMQTAVAAAQALEALGDKESFDSIAALLPKLKPVRSSMDVLWMDDLLIVLAQMNWQAAEPIINRYFADPAWAELLKDSKWDIYHPPN